MVVVPGGDVRVVVSGVEWAVTVLVWQHSPAGGGRWRLKVIIFCICFVVGKMVAIGKVLKVLNK